MKSSAMASKALLYIGLAVGVIGIGAAIAYGTANQQNYIPEGAVAAMSNQFLGTKVM
ncbi:MAG: hypothetical protein OEM89_03475 [Nitrosopumilus sp.]|nr:hypothetical protein [Nitrosopumilus sp.]